MSGEKATVMVEPEFPEAEIKQLESIAADYWENKCRCYEPGWAIEIWDGKYRPQMTFNQPLMILLQTYRDACKSCLVTRSESWQKFSPKSIYTFFCYFLNNTHHHCWSFESNVLFRVNCKRLVELCVTKMNDDSFCELELLTLVLNPKCNYHSFNSERVSKSVPPNSRRPVPDEALFARPPSTEKPFGWLVDLVNTFGTLDGFRLLLERFQHGQNLTVITMYRHIKPFDQCCDMLTDHTMEAYMLPIIELIFQHLENLSNEVVMEGLYTMIWLDMFILKVMLRLLQVPSASGRMSGLSMVNKTIDKMEGYWHSRDVDDDYWLTASKMAKWIKKNRVLQILFNDPLLQQQGIEMVENVCRFTAEWKVLTLEDLDSLLAAQSEGNNARVKSVHDLLEKLAADLTPEQLDHLFDQLEASWVGGTAMQQERILELMRRLIEQDRDGARAHRLRQLLVSAAPLDDATESADGAAAILCRWPSTSGEDPDESLWTEEEEVVLADPSDCLDSGVSTATLDQKDPPAPDQEDSDSRQTPTGGKATPAPPVADGESVPSTPMRIKRQVELQLREQHQIALRHMHEKHRIELEKVNLQLEKARQQTEKAQQQTEQARLVSEILRVQLERARTGTD